MATTEAAGPSSPGTRAKKYLTVRQAAFIGVGAMVGAGIFALLGAAGEVAGAAVWLSFLVAGFVAVLQGYSFAKLGARYPSAGGLLEYVAKATGNGHFTGVTSWLTYSANAIVTAMVAVSFGRIVAAGAVFVTFVFTTLIHEPASIVTLLAIVALSIGLDYGWKRSRPSSPVPVQVVP
jgi:amino acid transporter